MSARVAVIGGGISGLVAAYQLHQRSIDVTVIEASVRFGGPIFTERFDDFIVDAGPDSFLSTKPGGLELAKRLGIADRLINTRDDGGGTYIVRDDELHPLPEGITLLVPTQFKAIAETSLLDVRGKLRLLADYVIPARRDESDESVASFMTRRVGKQAFERLAEPLLSGIYAGDARKLGILSTFPRLRDVERRHGGLIRGAMAMRGNAPPQRERVHTPFVSFQGGLGEMIDALVRELDGADLRRNVAAHRITRQGECYQVHLSDGSSVEADGVIVATP
ncbi:MAG: protoporphyrinogen oxidase, partial [Chloroflexota bacterium]